MTVLDNNELERMRKEVIGALHNGAVHSVTKYRFILILKTIFPISRVSPWNRVIIQRLTGVWLVKSFPVLVVPGRSLSEHGVSLFCVDS
jgi:hypothetical protein